MPWKIEHRGDKFCVVKKADGSTVHCHDSEQQARDQMAALYANEGKAVTFLSIESEGQPPMNESEAVVYYGGAVKALGNGRVGGYGVLFTTADDPDLQKDFFTKATDLDLRSRADVMALWDHGLDSTLKHRKLGRATYKVDDEGVWFETKLNEADKYEKAIYKLAELGKLGWSTGSAPHLVERVPVKKSFELKSWPIIEVSLTHMPVEPRTAALPLKSVQHIELEVEEEVEATPLPPFTTKALEEAIKAAFDNDLENHSLKVATAVEELIAHEVKCGALVEGLQARTRNKQEFRAVKDGRAISQRRVEQMRELVKKLKDMAQHPLDIAADFEKMITDADTSRTQQVALQEAIQLQHQTFQQLKEGSNA